jgi:hypothetical protein
MSDFDLLFSNGEFNHSEGVGEFLDGGGWNSSGKDREFPLEAANYSMLMRAHVAR